MNGNGCISQLKTEVLSLTKKGDIDGAKKALSMFAKEIGAENVPKEFKILPRTITMFIKSNEGKEFCKFLQDSLRLLDFLNSPDKSDSTGHDVLDITGKETAVDNPVETLNKIRRLNNWLHKAWGLYDLSRVKFLEALKRDFNQFVLKPYYSGTLRATDDALNYLIKDFIIYKINRLKTYLDSINVNTSAIKDPFETDNPQEVIENILKTYRNIFYNEDGSLKLTSKQLKAYQNPDTRIKNSDKDIAQAYADYLVIDPFHLDSFIKTNVKTIEIKNSVGILTLANNKYGMKLGKGRQISSWQNEDSLYVISQHVDDTVLIEISSWPKYRKNSSGIIVAQSNEFADLNSVVNVFSKIMSIPNVKVMKELAPYNSETDPLIKKLRDEFKEAFGYTENNGERSYVIDEIISTYIDGKNITDIINSIPQNYNKLLPITFYLLVNDSNIFDNLKYDSDNKTKLYLDLNDKENIYTIYKNMYDSEKGSKSLFRLTSDVYLMINQLFLTHERKEIFGIIDSPDGVVKNYYSIGKANSRLNYLQSKLVGNYFPEKDLNFPGTTIESSLEGKEKSVTITIKPFTLGGTSNTYIIEIVNGKDIKFYINGSHKRPTDSEAKQILKELSYFFTASLKLDFNQKNNQLYDVYKGLLGNTNYYKVLSNLVLLSAKFIYGHEVSKKLKDLNSKEFKEALLKYYDGTKKMELASGITYNLVDTFRTVYAMLSRLSMANDINEGVAGNVIVKGGAGELINSVVLSSLSTKFHSWFEEKSKPTKIGDTEIPSAIEDFSIGKVAKRISFFRDYVNKKGEVKSATSMSVEELFIANFVYDFYGEDNSNSLDSVYASTMGVFSDKPNLGRIEVYRHAEIPTGAVNEQGLPIKKKIKDLSHTELKEIAARELGVFYDRMYIEINRNLAILNKYSQLAKSTGYSDFYSIDNDYEHTREEYVDEFGNIRRLSKKDLLEDIHNAIMAAQNAGEDIEINEFLYFLWDGDTLHSKHSIFSEINKNGVGQEAFFERKEAELVVNLLLDLKLGIKFIDYDGLLINSLAIKNMRLKNPQKKEGVKDYWATKDSLIIAKIISGDSSKDLITKRDITKWTPFGRLLKFINETGYTGVNISKLNINGDFDLLYLLNVLNDLDIRQQVDNYFRLKDFKTKAKEVLKEKYTKLLKNKEITERQQQFLIALYQEYLNTEVLEGRREGVRRNLAETLQKEISDEELINYLTLRYVNESDSEQWKKRWINSVINSLLEELTEAASIPLFIKDNKLSRNKELKEILDKEYSTKELYTLKINPEIQRYNTLNYLFSEETLNSTVGSSVNHEVKKYTEDLTLLGAIESAAQTKRNVAETGAKNQYTRGDIRGMSTYMTIAVMEDPKASISTVNGIEDNGATKPMDGATIGNYITRMQELFSLGSLKAGVDNSKPLGNDLNTKTGTGTIIKTAVFVLTNARIRSSELNIRMHRVMNHVLWDSSYDGNFLENYDGDAIKYRPIIVYKPSTNSYWLRTNLSITLGDTPGLTMFDEVELTDELIASVEGLNTLIESGNISSEELDRLEKITKVNRNISTSRPIRTNYELWDLFGGAYSASIIEGHLTYQNDDTSLYNVYIAATNAGKRITLGLLTRPTNEDVFLPLKEAKIDWIVTAGAIKLGAANINTTDLMNVDGYLATTQRISTADIGMLLNPEHETDKSTITLMTLVVNALGLKGFSADVAYKVYEALGNLTNLSLKDLFEGIELEISEEELDKLEGDKKVKNTMASIILKSILGTSETGGDLLSALVLQLKDAERNGQDFEIIKHKLPISDPYILNKIVSNIASTFGKMGIRIPFPGSMNVLVPSDGIYKLRGGKLLEIASTSRYFNERDLIPNSEAEFEQKRLEDLLEEAKSNPITNISKITIGASYYVTITEGDFDGTNPLTKDILSGKSIKLDDLSTYYQLRKLLKGRKYSLVEDIKAGRDLAPYNCTFETTSGESFMLWDLDSIKHIHLAENFPEVIELIRLTYSDEEIIKEFHIDPSQLNRQTLEAFLKDFKILINRKKLLELNAIGSGNSNIVYIDGERKVIVKNSTSISPYELIASKNYATTFGLQVGDNLSEISEDRYFFLKRFILKQLTTSNSTDTNNYDLVLKTISGKNYYILYLDLNTTIPKELKPISDELFFNNLDWVGDKVYRLDINGNRLYALPYEVKDGKIEYKAKIYVDSKGNEIIYTSDITNFINNLNYNNIEFSPRILDTGPLKVIEQIGESKKNSALKFYNSFISKEDKKLIVLKTYNEIALKELLKSIIETRRSELVKLNTTLLAGNPVNMEDFENPIIRQIIRSGIETHTSFLKSLDYIVSRTPAQSHLSFMPMKIVAFDESGKNSAYVSRYLLYLQGSDFDVDKASLLGSVFHNGKYVTWSPFMSLASREALRASETLPFPSGKTLLLYNPSRIKQLESKEELTVEENLELQQLKEIEQKFYTTRIYDKLDKPINLIWENDKVIFNLTDYDKDIVLYKTFDENGEILYTTDITLEEFNFLSPMSRYVLERALVDKIPEGARFTSQLDLSHLGIVGRLDLILGNRGSIKDSTKYDYLLDIILFNLIFSDLLIDSDYTKPESILLLAVLINSYNNYGLAVNFDTAKSGDVNLMKKIIKDINKHNTFFNGKEVVLARDAVINFVSSNMFQVSCDPANLVQAMTSVDYQTEIIKGIANESPLAKLANHFDKGNQMTTFRLARLTLSGKQNTGIEASSLKVYEAFNLHTDTILNYGTQEELADLISKPINIAGKEINLIANAYCKNMANIKSKAVYDALKLVNNDEDSALWLSAFLSLSTDNAKDPTLSKILANPEMIGLYNAGYVLGLPIDLLTDVMMSPAANALMDIQAGNILYGRPGQLNVTSALQILEGGLNFSYLNAASMTLINHVLKGVGINVTKLNSYSLLSTILPNKYSKSDLYRVRKLISLMKLKAFGDIEELYNPLNLELEFKRKLKNLKRQLLITQNKLQADQLVLQQKEAEGRGHKREDTKIENRLIDIENLELEILDLEEIILNVLNGLPISNKNSEIYKWAKSVLQSIENIDKVDMNLSQIKDSQVTSDSIRILKKFFQQMDSYLDMMESIVYTEKILGLDGQTYHALDIIKLLNEMATEMSLIRPILGLNQQLPNSKENQLAFIRKFENILQEKAGTSNIKTEAIKQLNEENAKYGIEKNMISIELFAFSPSYRQLAIKAYGSIMYKINILDVLTKNLHYLGYLRTMAAYHYGMKKFSILYRTQNEIAEKVIRGKMKVNSKTEIEKYLKQASKYISRIMNNMFMRQKNIEISIPGKGLITLGTTEGNIAFKEWMDLTVIPKYKSRLNNNKFIQSLDDLPYNKTDNRNTVINYTTGVDSMSQNEVDRIQFAEVSEALSDLSIKTPEPTSGLPLTDLFFYYDLIAYDRQPSLRSLTPLFNNLIGGGGHKLSLEYIAYVSDLDLNGSSIINLDDLTIDTIARFVAPVVSIYAIDDQKLPYIFVKDPLDLKIKLLKRKEKSSNLDPELAAMIEDFGSDYNDAFNDYDIVSEEFEGDSYTPITLDAKCASENCEYEIVGSNISSKRNPYLMSGAHAYTETQLLSALEGKVIITPTTILWGQDYVTIGEDGESLDYSDGFKTKLDKIGINIKDLLKFKISVIDDNGIKNYEFNAFDVINLLENPCKR